MRDEGCEQSGQQDWGWVEITETLRPVSVIWIWSISIPSERARSVASFINPFLDCISHTEDISSSGFQPHAEEGACRLQEQLVVDWPKEHGRRTSWRG